MPIIYRENTVLSGSVSFSDDVQIASGVTITIAAGAVVNLSGRTILNFGTLLLAGTSSSFATLSGGTYSTESTKGILNSTFGNLKGVSVDSFFSGGALILNSTVVEGSTIGALPSTTIKDSLFLNSPLDLGIKTDVVVERTTFKNSLVSQDAWVQFGSQAVRISSSNFVHDGIAIQLKDFFSGTHALQLSGNYMYIPVGATFEGKVVDRDDTLKITTDISQASFISQPVANTKDGFYVGSVGFRFTELGGTQAPVVAPRSGTASNDTMSGTPADESFVGGGGNEGLSEILCSRR